MDLRRVSRISICFCFVSTARSIAAQLASKYAAIRFCSRRGGREMGQVLKCFRPTAHYRMEVQASNPEQFLTLQLPSCCWNVRVSQGRMELLRTCTSTA